MPLYEYQAVEQAKSCTHCCEPFEVFQNIADPPLVKCQHCGAAIRRIIFPVGFKMGKKHLLTDQNLKKKGFTKLVNEGDGKFRKVL